YYLNPLRTNRLIYRRRRTMRKGPVVWFIAGGVLCEKDQPSDLSPADFSYF
ncbi:hypothetical protein J6590_104392, partial [Homalodisca vitripennis]